MVIRRVSDYLGTPLPLYNPNRPASPAPSGSSSDSVAPPSAGSSTSTPASAPRSAPDASTIPAPEPAAPSSPETSHNLQASQAQTRLERAELQYAQAKARLLALKNRAATQARKLDTRRKVVLGGALMDLAARDSSAAAMLDRLVRNLPREQDRKAFDGWTPRDALPEDATAPAATASASGSELAGKRP
jgi:hypothetical protein